MITVRGGRLDTREHRSLALRVASLALSVALTAVGGCGGGGGPAPAASSPAAAEAASIARGRQVAAGTAPCESGSRCFACATCHGIDGQGSGITLQPRLAGQISQYLYRSLRDFASGRRENPTMQEVASGLTDQQMRDVAAYFATLPPEPLGAMRQTAAGEGASAQVLERGRALATTGSAAQGVQSCATCHGSSGQGMSPLYPALAGQYPGYLEQQLQAFKEGTRRGELAPLMQPIAQRLSREQMHGVADYYGSLSRRGARSP